MGANLLEAGGQTCAVANGNCAMKLEIALPPSARQIAYGALMVLTVACSRPNAGIPSAAAVLTHAELGTADSLGNLARHDADRGRYPQAPLIDVGGTLYGTTNNGGAFRSRKTCHGGCGTVFSITTSGVVKVLHSFGNAQDGQYPAEAGLVNVGGTLYGTTSEGGAFGGGTVFSITTDGVENVLHSFGGQGDGTDPIGGSLLEVRGTLYGTTWGGGAYGSQTCPAFIEAAGCGTVFSITTSGTEKVLHSFGNGDDAQHPWAGLVHFGTGTTLYGMTFYGGTHRTCSTGDERTGCGTVFSITTSGTEKVLHSFGEGHDGKYPEARLLPVHGALYGTTTEGGAFGSGTVFVVTTDGKATILHSFSNLYRNDGNLPRAGLIDLKGTLYGTTYSGGACDVGTVFSITTTGVETVLHSFFAGYICRGKIDGAVPLASLINVNGLLYGTTEYGGGHPKSCPNGGSFIKGCGTVFSITTGGQLNLLYRFH